MVLMATTFALPLAVEYYDDQARTWLPARALPAGASLEEAHTKASKLSEELGRVYAVVERPSEGVEHLTVYTQGERRRGRLRP